MLVLLLLSQLHAHYVHIKLADGNRINIDVIIFAQYLNVYSENLIFNNFIPCVFFLLCCNSTALL